MSAAQLAGSAAVSPDGVYRYELRRWWARGEVVRFIMLNPSTADATVDDPTIRRCVGFARSWGYGSLVVHNLYALRATDPTALAAHPDPVGPDNDDHLRHWAPPRSFTVCAWGAHPMAARRAPAVLALLRAAGFTPHHLGLTAAGAPRHPLYLPGATAPAPLIEEGPTRA